jgi:hypothetical protein
VAQDGLFSYIGTDISHHSFRLVAISLIAIGFILGLKHALDADHLIAVSTLVSERKTLHSSGIAGIMWGIGHTASLLFVGIIVLALDITIPETVAQTAELLVALMLIGLGVRVLWKLQQGEVLHVHPHVHGNRVHSHPHLHDAEQESEESAGHSHSLLHGSFGAGKGSLAVGVVHGLAGSAGLMLLLAATIQSFWIGVFYILSFGVGSIGGMLLMSMVLSTPFLLTGTKPGRFYNAIRGIAGVLSICFGGLLAWEIGFVEGLLR